MVLLGLLAELSVHLRRDTGAAVVEVDAAVRPGR
jgi:hypothetical protein